MQKLKNEQLNRIDADTFRAKEKTPVIVVLDNVRSALNVGSVFRTADAFLLEKIYLCGITAAPPHKDILKSALGSTQSMGWEYATNTVDVIATLKANGCKIIAVEQAVESISLLDFKPGKENKTVLIFGHEVNGIDTEVMKLCDACVEVPQIGTKHSLNIAVCAGIVIWDIYTKIIK